MWGSELPDADLFPSQLSWPALLADHLGMPHQCLASPGCGNLQIAEQILNHVDQEQAFFVINWTYIDRFDYANPNNDKWSTLRPGAKDSLAEHYYRNLHSQYKDKLTTLMHIKLCVDAMLKAGHEFRMTYMDHLILETQWHISPAVTSLQECIRPHLLQFDQRNMLEYSHDRGHAVGHLQHPLEAAHKDLFQYALTNFAIHKVKTA